jgi:hypothetical protein
LTLRDIKSGRIAGQIVSGTSPDTPESESAERERTLEILAGTKPGGIITKVVAPDART